MLFTGAFSFHRWQLTLLHIDHCVRIRGAIFLQLHIASVHQLWHQDWRYLSLIRDLAQRPREFVAWVFSLTLHTCVFSFAFGNFYVINGNTVIYVFFNLLFLWDSVWLTIHSESCNSAVLALLIYSKRHVHWWTLVTFQPFSLHSIPQKHIMKRKLEFF